MSLHAFEPLRMTETVQSIWLLLHYFPPTPTLDSLRTAPQYAFTSFFT